MVKEQVDMEYISLHGHIRNTAQTQKGMQNHSWEQAGVPDQWKRIQRTTHNLVGRTRGKNRSVSRTGPALGRWGNWSRGLIPTSGQSSESEEKHLRLRVEQLTCGSLYRMRLRQSLPQPHKPWTGTLVPWKAQRLGAGVWGLWSSPRARAAVDCRDTDWGDVREEIMVGNASGGTPGSHGSKEILLSHTQVVEPITIATLPHGQHQQLNSREAGPSNARCTEYRVGPHPGGPSMCLTVQSTEWDPSQGAPLSAWHSCLQSGTPAMGGPLSAWHSSLQSGTPPGGPLYVPDVLNNREGPQAREPPKSLNGAEPQRKTGQRGLLIARYKRLRKDSDRAIPPAAEAACPCTLGAARVPASQAAAPPSA